MENNKFKEKTPQETISFLSSLLMKELNASPVVSLIDKPELKVASCHISLSSDMTVGSNGKGVNSLYAIASGYSELIERLSTYANIGRKCEIPYFADEHLNEEGKIVAPFYNPIIKEFENYEILKTLGCSTGMAAGNTYPEAIVQGLCEVLERDCIRKFFKKELEVNSIIENSQILYSNIEELEKRFNAKAIFFEVSPISIPVVLMILIRDNDTIGMNFGCAPSVQIACERCVTEFLQNNDGKSLFKFMPIVDCPVDFKLNYYCYSVNGITFLPKEIIEHFFNSNKIFSEQSISRFKVFNSNEEVIKEFLLNVSYFKKILIRDYGFLGYPVIQIIIPDFEDPIIECNSIDTLEVYNYLGFCYQRKTNHNDFIRGYFRKMLDGWLTSIKPIHYEIRNQLYQKSILFDSTKEKSFDFFKNF